MTSTILFVCTGNVCRSPMAEGLFNARARRAGEEARYIAKSAGTRALDNQRAAEHAVAAMTDRHIDISNHRGRTITEKMVAEADVVVTMTRSQMEALAAEFPTYRRKLHLMYELKGSFFDVADPYGSTFDDYAQCAQLLQDLLENGYDKLKTWIDNANQSRA